MTFTKSQGSEAGQELERLRPEPMVVPEAGLGASEDDVSACLGFIWELWLLTVTERKLCLSQPLLTLFF